MSFVESILVPLHSLDRSKSTELKLRRIITNNEDNDQDTPSSCDNNNPGDGYGNDPGKQQCVTQPKLHNSFLFSSVGLDVQENGPQFTLQMGAHIPFKLGPICPNLCEIKKNFGCLSVPN